MPSSDSCKTARSPTPTARRITVDTLVELGTNESETLLRVGALLDPLPGVEEKAPPESIVAESLSGLMRLQPARSLEFVASFLHRMPGEALSAALAIGASRQPEAFSILEEFWNATGEQDLQIYLLLRIALTRDTAPIDFLLGVLRNENERLALAAIEALALFASDNEITNRIRECASVRDEAGIQSALREHIDQGTP